MSDSTPILDQLSLSQANLPDRINEIQDALSPSALYGRRASTCTGLVWGYYGGRLDGMSVANGTVTLGASTTSYVVADRSTGAVSASTGTTNWNDADNYIQLYVIVTGASTVTSWQDWRQAIGASGGGGGAPVFAPVVTVSGTSLTADASNSGNYSRFTSGSAKTYSFDDGETYTVGAEYHGRNVGAADLTITEVGTFVVNPPTDGTLVIPPGGTFTVKIVGAAEADLFGVTVPL